jgi:hypothetical protein
MLRFASAAVCAALVLSVSAHATPAHAQRTIPPVTLSDDAECWYGELYGVTSIICRDDNKLYRCTVARTECWYAIPPGPYTRGHRFNAHEGALESALPTERARR